MIGCFKPRARLMLELGEQLIKNESVAVLELIKNSYDAFAPNVYVELNNLDDPAHGQIIIRDDGVGMTSSIVETCWMEPGTINKKRIIEECKEPIFHNGISRVPLGEKGIGRFGAHKLGNHITLVSRAENTDNEVYFEIKWTDFDNDKYLNEVPVEIFERTPEVFVGNQCGTLILIDDLRHKWTKGEVRSVYKSILALNSPFKSNDSFTVNIFTNHEDWVDDLKKYRTFLDRSLFNAHLVLEGDTITSYKYSFTPWSVLNKVTPRTSSEYEGIKLEDIEHKSLIDLSKYSIGKIEIDLHIFDLDTYIVNLGFQNDKKLLKDYLKQNGGISIYRDNMRLYEYGESGNDWLGLGNRRINNPSKTLSGRITVGAVYLDRLSSTDLIEKTSREGFIENEAYREFVKAVLFAVSRVEMDRMLDKADLRQFYSSSFKEPVVDSVKKMIDSVEKMSIDNESKQELRSALYNIEREYKEISGLYVKSSSLGLNLSMVVHEIDKIIKELGSAVQKEGVSDHLKELISDLEIRIKGYSDLIKNTKIRKIELSKLVNDSMKIFKYRIKAHDLHIDNHIGDSLTKVSCADSLVRSAIMNILDNSIYWLDKYGIKDKRIYFGEIELDDGYRGLLILDNGKGFTLPKDKLTVPFISKKDDGMGLGLHLVEQIMSINDGQLMFPDNGDLDIPEIYKYGAAIVLAFKEA